MFDVSEARHQSATEIVKAAGRAPLLSTWPCVTEASHILERLDGQLALLTFVRRGSLTVRDFAAADLDRFMGWMKKYRDHPMDFADASLVWLAVETGVTSILTIDRADFESYRLPSGRRFRLIAL